MATKLDAQNARAREALILPYKRKIASLAIRADFFKDEGKKGDVAERAREAIAEIDAQVEDLAAIKFPAETKAAVAQAIFGFLIVVIWKRRPSGAPLLFWAEATWGQTPSGRNNGSPPQSLLPTLGPRQVRKRGWPNCHTSPQADIRRR